jgi:hypothetical protein
MDIDVSFIGGGNLEKTTNLSQDSNKVNIMLYQAHLAMDGVRTHNFSADMH